MNTNSTNGNYRNESNKSLLLVKTLEYDAHGKPAYAEYDGYGTLLSYTPVEPKAKWHTLTWVAILACILLYFANDYIRSNQYEQEKTSFMQHAVLKGWSVDKASKTWDQMQDEPEDTNPERDGPYSDHP